MKDWKWNIPIDGVQRPHFLRIKSIAFLYGCYKVSLSRIMYNEECRHVSIPLCIYFKELIYYNTFCSFHHLSIITLFVLKAYYIYARKLQFVDKYLIINIRMQYQNIFRTVFCFESLWKIDLWKSTKHIMYKKFWKSVYSFKTIFAQVFGDKRDKNVT